MTFLTVSSKNRLMASSRSDLSPGPWTAWSLASKQTWTPVVNHQHYNDLYTSPIKYLRRLEKILLHENDLFSVFKLYKLLVFWHLFFITLR
jgi:hypothetical protein